MNAIGGWLRDLVHGAVQTLIDGPRLLRLAPWIVLLVIVPEAVQHAWEIKLGLFESRAAFKALQMDQVRMAIGAVKIAGYLAAILLAALYWGRRYGLAQWKTGVAWRTLGLSFFLNVAASAAGFALVWVLPSQYGGAVDLAVSAATFPLLVYLVGALLGDRAMTLRAAYTRGWGKVLAMALLGALFLLPAQALHSAHHAWALGQPLAVVIALMAWDALWTGLMAAWIGTALATGYGRADRAGGGQNPGPLANS